MIKKIKGPQTWAVIGNTQILMLREYDIGQYVKINMTSSLTKKKTFGL